MPPACRMPFSLEDLLYTSASVESAVYAWLAALFSTVRFLCLRPLGSQKYAHTHMHTHIHANTHTHTHTHSLNHSAQITDGSLDRTLPALCVSEARNFCGALLTGPPRPSQSAALDVSDVESTSNDPHAEEPTPPTLQAATNAALRASVLGEALPARPVARRGLDVRLARVVCVCVCVCVCV
jgi:hypothetical protein